MNVLSPKKIALKIALRGLLILVGVVGVLAGAIIALLPLPGDIPVLMYHFTGTEDEASQSKNVLPEKSFRHQMQTLKTLGYHVISLEDYEATRQGKRQPQGKEIVLTFDDGNEAYRSVFLPILKEFGFPSANFLVSESVKGKLHASMSLEEVQEIAKEPLVTLGVHSKTHPFLTEVDSEQLKDEIMNSKKDLETWLGQSFLYFSYPFGDFNPEVMNVVKEAGFHLAFTTSPKKLRNLSEGDFSITRIKMGKDSDNPIILVGMASGLYHHFKQFRHSLKVRFRPAVK